LKAQGQLGQKGPNTKTDRKFQKWTFSVYSHELTCKYPKNKISKLANIKMAGGDQVGQNWKLVFS
jgi:hypothetical protein